MTYEVMSSAYDISCPDPECEKQGVMHMSEIENLVGKELTDKHKMFRLNTGKYYVGIPPGLFIMKSTISLVLPSILGYCHQRSMGFQSVTYKNTFS